jgi:hypothetical protein
MRTRQDQRNRLTLRIGVEPVCRRAYSEFLLLTGRPPLAIGEIHEHAPIACGHGMFARAQVIAEAVADQLVLGRHLGDFQAVQAEQTIYSVSGLKHLKLTSRVGPPIFLSGGKEYSSGCAERHQIVLVKRQTFRCVIEGFKRRVEPVWKMIVDDFDRFTGFAAARRRTSAPGLVRESNRYAFIERGSEKGRLAVA